MADVRLRCRKLPFSKTLQHVLSATDVVRAVEAVAVGDLWVDAFFGNTTDFWKEERDARAMAGRFRVAALRYSANGDGLYRHREPWADEERPQVVVVRLTPVPRDVLHGLPARSIAAGLLAQAVARLCPKGLPAGPAPKEQWMLDLELGAPTRTFRALLRPWNGVEHAVATILEAQLNP